MVSELLSARDQENMTKTHSVEQTSKTKVVPTNHPFASEANLITIQSFNQCSSLISIKLNTTNYLLWRSQVVPLVRSLGIEHHLLNDNPPNSKIVDKEGTNTINPQYLTWLTNDGLLTSWLLGIISEKVLAMIEGLETTRQVWKSLEETLLSITKENEIHIKESLHNLKKGNMSLEDYIKKNLNICVISLQP